MEKRSRILDWYVEVHLPLQPVLEFEVGDAGRSDGVCDDSSTVYRSGWEKIGGRDKGGEWRDGGGITSGPMEKGADGRERWPDWRGRGHGTRASLPLTSSGWEVEVIVLRCRFLTTVVQKGR